MVASAKFAKVMLSLTSWYWRAIRGSARPTLRLNQNWSGTKPSSEFPPRTAAIGLSAPVVSPYQISSHEP